MEHVGSFQGLGMMIKEKSLDGANMRISSRNHLDGHTTSHFATC